MSEQSHSKSKRNFKRKLNGKGIVFILVFVLLVLVFAGKIVAELRWNSFLVSNKPDIYFKQIIKDLQIYEKKHKDYPDALGGNSPETNWRWSVSKTGNKPIVEQTGIRKGGAPQMVNRFQYKNYEYLYANIGNTEIGPMVVIWAVPVWSIEPLGAYLEYTGHTGELQAELDKWQKETQTYYVIVTPDKKYVWDGILPPQINGTAGLERNLQPVPDWLSGKKMFQNYAPDF